MTGPVIGIDASRAFAPLATGTEHYSTQIIRQLVQRGRWSYRLYCRQALDQPPAGAELRLLRPGRLWTHLALGRELATDRPDLLFVPAHVLPLWPVVPSVVTVHDLGYLAWPEAHTAFQRFYLNWSTRRHVRLARRLIADSSVTREDLVRHYQADPAKVAVVHLAVDADLAPAAREDVDRLRLQLGIPPGTPYLLHVGTRQPRKNLRRLIQAFAATGVKHPEVFLVLAGGVGWGGEDLAEVAARAGVGQRVLLPGYVARTDLAALYTGAVAAVLPSLYEGFGLTALEAMACGTPVLCSNTSSLPEVVGAAALQFDPLDASAMAAAMSEVLDDEAVRIRLRQLGHERVAGFAWARCAEATEAVLATALGAGA
jgi:glycosyltransferase involved in cell wall biosynthesis